MERISIRRVGNLLEIIPALSLLKNILQYTEVIYLSGRDLSAHIAQQRRLGILRPSNRVFKRRLLYAEADGDSLVCPAGLTSRVLKCLKSANIDYDYVDERTFKIPSPKYENIGELRLLMCMCLKKK